METTSLRLAGVSLSRAPEAGFADFVRTNTSILIRKAYLLTGSGLAAEELVQDTLVRLYPRWAKVENADIPLAYVQRSLTNNFLSQWRRRTRREILTDVVPDRPGGGRTEGEIADRDEMWALLKILSSRQRAVLVLRYYEGLSDEDIADYLDCRAGTVRSLASRGLATLRHRAQAA